MQDNLHMEFLAFNVDFNSPKFRLLCSKSSPYGAWICVCLCRSYYCKLYTDFQGGATLDWCCRASYKQ